MVIYFIEYIFMTFVKILNPKPNGKTLNSLTGQLKYWIRTVKVQYDTKL